MATFEKPVIGRSEDAQPYKFLDTLTYVLVSSRATDGRSCVVKQHLREGHATPMHIHSVDETIHVLDGQIAFHTSEDVHTVEAGASVVLPQDEQHALVALEAAAILITTSPGGFDEFVTAVGQPVDDERVPEEPPSEGEISRVNELASTYDIKIVGPPPMAT